MKNSLRSLPIFLAFLCMGFGDVVGPLTSQIQDDYDLSNTAAGLVTMVGFIMFGLLSIPMAIVQDRKNKKYVLVLGLIVALFGLVMPILGSFSSFVLLLGSLLLLGTGATMLQVAGNPIMRDVSPEGKYSRNLSFGQFVKAIGSLSGSLIPLIVVRHTNSDWRILFPIYSIAVFITVLYVFLTPIKEKEKSSSQPATFSSSFGILSNPYILLMVIGIFLYVGAEVSMSAKLPNFLKEKLNFDIKQMGLFGTLFFFLSLMTGRFLGGVILNWINPKRFLIITTIVALLGIGGLFISNTIIMAFVSIAVIGLGFANIFPLIFSITVDAFPEKTNEISGLMVTAIVGGAVVPVIFGVVADVFSLMAGFLVPAVCVIYILFISSKTFVKS